MHVPVNTLARGADDQSSLLVFPGRLTSPSFARHWRWLNLDVGCDGRHA